MANNPEQPPQIAINPSHVVGIVQRILLELHSYLTQPAHGVDPAYVMARLEEAAQFTQQLPASANIPVNGQAKSEQRAN